VKIGFKFQSLGKISKISTADLTPLHPSSFRSIPTLLLTNLTMQLAVRPYWPSFLCLLSCSQRYAFKPAK